MAPAGGLQLPEDVGHQRGPAQPHRQLCPKPAQRQRRAAQPQHPGELAPQPSALPPLWDWAVLKLQPQVGMISIRSQWVDPLSRTGTSQV